MREKEKAVVVSQECIGTGIYSMIIKTKAADSAVAGQFEFQFTVRTKLNCCQDLSAYVR